nr:molybdate ABC transporter substrate-binding protein [Roseisalinus antarcticus]
MLSAGLTLFGAGVSAAETVTVFAAASLKTALDEIVAMVEAETGTSVLVSYAGSSALARQIQLGAPADIFLSANTAWMDVLADEGLLEDGTRQDLLGNALVLIAHDPGAAPAKIGPAFDLATRLGGGRLAMALVEAVPAGIYGKAALECLGLWDGIAASVAQTDNARTALALVATGEAPYGIVYATDAAAEPRVTVVGTFPANSHPPIIYPVADLTTRDLPEETAFLDALRSPAARQIFEAQGFVLLDGPG